MKSCYVRLMRRLRALLSSTGLLARLERGADSSRIRLWLRSLVAIYDLDDLARLDIPWWTFASTDVVARHLASIAEPRVFEWGSGSSTLWLAKRVQRVISVEHDPDWARELAGRLPTNVDLMVVPSVSRHPVTVGSAKPGYAGEDFSDYVAAIDQVGGDFDLIVIDGRARGACLARAWDRLAEGGMILFDNVDRARYRASIRSLSTPAHVVWTRGLTPTLPYPTRTALLRRVGAE